MRRTSVLLALAIAVSSCQKNGDRTTGGATGLDSPSTATTSPPWFQDATEEAGLDFVHVAWDVQRFWMPEISSGGVGFLDYDGDGWLDIYCVQSGDPHPEARTSESNRLFRSQRGATFTDVTAGAGVGDLGYGHGLATGDYDQDGDVDLYVANLRANVLYRNNGDETFTDVTTLSGTGETQWSTACSFVDIDRDGDLDLFVVNNLDWSPEAEMDCKTSYGEPDYCAPKSIDRPTRDTLYRNDGDGAFTDVTCDAGISAAAGIGLGLSCADFDGDGHTDIYVANDGMVNRLWMNDGTGWFRDQGLVRGCALNLSGVPEASMGVHLIDAGNDGDWDLFVTHVVEETNTFFENTNGFFVDSTAATGLSGPSLSRTGFGVGFHDFDHDGALDVFVANGRVFLRRPYCRPAFPFAEPNQLFRGSGGIRFVEIEGGPASEPEHGTSRAAAFGDYDNDGDVDVVYTDLHESVRLLRNESPSLGNWIQIRALNAHGSDALGATATITTPQGVQRRLCHTSYSYCAANDPRIHFGLGEARVVSEMLVTWPDGVVERFGPLRANELHIVRRGEGPSEPRKN